MLSPSSTFSFRRSFLLGAALVLVVQGWLFWMDFNSPTFFGFDITSQKYSEVERFRDQGQIDLLVVGHSQALNSIDPEILEEHGLRTYNFGMAGTDLHMQAIAVRDYLLPRIRPKAILWSLGLQTKEQQLWASNARILDSPCFRLQSLPLGSHLVTVAKNLLPFHRRHLHQWIETLVTPRNPRYRTDGFMEVYWDYYHILRSENYDVPEDFKNNLRPWEVPIPRALGGGPRVEKIEEHQLVYSLERARADIRSAFQAARDAGVDIYAFSAPVHVTQYRPPSIYQNATKGADREFVEWLGNLIREYDVPYVNYGYYAPISKDDHLFYNHNHLNIHGARKLTEVLAGHLFGPGVSIPREFSQVLSLAQRKRMAPTSNQER